MLDFDNIDEWSPELFDVLRLHMPKSIEHKFQTTEFKYIEDSKDLFFELTNRETIIDAMLVWLRSTKILAYHGSRLTESEIIALRRTGMLPLKALNRRDRLTRALSSHPKWSEIVSKLDITLQDYGQNELAGCRENQVHLTLSKFGLLYGFNHYLIYGSEFDQRVACELLGEEGLDLLAHDGESRIIKLAVPGSIALDAAHSSFSIVEMRARREIPNIVNEFITSWCYRLACLDFQPRKLKIDCGMVFDKIVPADWIIDIETI